LSDKANDNFQMYFKNGNSNVYLKIWKMLLKLIINAPLVTLDSDLQIKMYGKLQANLNNLLIGW